MARLTVEQMKVLRDTESAAREAVTKAGIRQTLGIIAISTTTEEYTAQKALHAATTAIEQNASTILAQAIEQAQELAALRLAQRPANVLDQLAAKWEAESVALFTAETNKAGVWGDNESKAEHNTLQRCIQDLRAAAATAQAGEL